MASFKLIIQLIVSVVILAAGARVLIWAANSRPEPAKEVQTATAPRVETATISDHDEGLTIESDGTVVPFREITLATEVAGRIRTKAKACRAGNYVEEGTLLFEIDPVDYDLEVRRLRNEVRQAEIAVHSADVELENAQSLIALAEEDLALQRREVRRLEPLTSQGIASRSEMDRAKRTEVSARNAVEVLKNRVRVLVTQREAQRAALDLATTRLEKAQIDLDRTKILAPISGVIVSELVEQDSYVQRGTSLVMIEDTSAAEIICNLRMDQLYWLWEQVGSLEKASIDTSHALNYELPKISATVIYRVAGREFAWEGRLDRYDGIGLNPRTRTVPCRLVVQNPREGRSVHEPDGSDGSVPPALVRGMFVAVSLIAKPKVEFASVPISALKPGNVIWRVIDGRLNINTVRVARRLDDVALLERNDAVFQIGDAVVTSPLPTPIEGMELDDGATKPKARLAEAPAEEAVGDLLDGAVLSESGNR